MHDPTPALLAALVLPGVILLALLLWLVLSLHRFALRLSLLRGTASGGPVLPAPPLAMGPSPLGARKSLPRQAEA
jgi:hypothetical protein